MKNQKQNTSQEEENQQDYSEHYSEESFWKKIHNAVHSAPKDLINAVLTLFYVLIDNKVSPVIKGIIVLALGYFIFPLDLIPDATPFIGYLDDLAIVLEVFNRIQHIITPQHRKKAADAAKHYQKTKN